MRSQNPVCSRTALAYWAIGKTEEALPPHDNLHLPLIEDFTQAVLENRAPTVTGEIGLEVNQILTKIYKHQ